VFNVGYKLNPEISNGTTQLKELHDIINKKNGVIIAGGFRCERLFSSPLTQVFMVKTDEMKSMDWHTHPDSNEILIVLRDKLIVMLKNKGDIKKYKLGNGNSINIKKGQCHKVMPFSKKTEVLVALVPPEEQYKQ